MLYSTRWFIACILIYVIGICGFFLGSITFGIICCVLLLGSAIALRITCNIEEAIENGEYDDWDDED